MSDTFTEVKLIDSPKVLTTVRCTFKSHKQKERKACYFGPVTFTNDMGQTKILRDECYLLMQNENLHNSKCDYIEIPRN